MTQQEEVRARIDTWIGEMDNPYIGARSRQIARDVRTLLESYDAAAGVADATAQLLETSTGTPERDAAWLAVLGASAVWGERDDGCG